MRPATSARGHVTHLYVLYVYVLCNYAVYNGEGAVPLPAPNQHGPPSCAYLHKCKPTHRRPRLPRPPNLGGKRTGGTITLSPRQRHKHIYTSMQDVSPKPCGFPGKVVEVPVGTLARRVHVRAARPLFRMGEAPPAVNLVGPTGGRPQPTCASPHPLESPFLWENKPTQGRS